MSPEESQVVFHLEKAYRLMTTYHERLRMEMHQIREKGRLAHEELSKITQVFHQNQASLNVCQNSLQALETTVGEVYIREKDMSKSAVSLEEENHLLRERLRKMAKIEFRRGDLKGNSSSSNGIRAPALLVYNNQTIAAFSSVRFTLDDDYNLSIEDVVRKIKIPIVKGFDHLKVIRSNNNEYRLTLSNPSGNQFFDHKKYDKFYSMIPNSMKYIRTSFIHTEDNKEINWLDMHSRCGFMACFQLKPGPLESAPEVILVKDKTKVGSLSPLTGYFDFMDLIVSSPLKSSSRDEEVKFTSPFLDRNRQGQYFIQDSAPGSEKKRIPIELSMLEVQDKIKFNEKIKAAFP